LLLRYLQAIQPWWERLNLTVCAPVTARSRPRSVAARFRCVVYRSRDCGPALGLFPITWHFPAGGSAAHHQQESAFAHMAPDASAAMATSAVVRRVINEVDKPAGLSNREGTSFTFTAS
jgi:hypothetical protein